MKKSEFMDLRAGDVVLIASEWKPYSRHNASGKMDKWLGSAMTVRKNCGDWVKMEEDRQEARECGQTGWDWYPSTIDRLLRRAGEDDPDEDQAPVDEDVSELLGFMI